MIQKSHLIKKFYINPLVNENGKTKLEKYFQDIKLYDRKEVYEITDLDLYYQIYFKW